VAGQHENVDGLREAYEQLARRVVGERLAFADRVQEALDDAHRLQGEITQRDAQIAQLQQDVEKLRARVDSLHAELIEAHRNNEALEQSRSFRYTAPLRNLSGALRRRQT
jgi:uncharacterized coiled-coil DUF342 family protein